MLEAKCRILSRCYADSSGLLRNGRHRNMAVERERERREETTKSYTQPTILSCRLISSYLPGEFFSNPFACWWGFTTSLSQRKTHVNTHARLIFCGGSHRSVVWFLPPNVYTCGLAEALCRYFNLSCLCWRIVFERGSEHCLGGVLMDFQFFVKR